MGRFSSLIALAAVVTVTVTGCGSGNGDQAAQAPTATTAVGSELPPVGYRTAATAAGDVTANRYQLIGMTGTQARELLASGSWTPEVLEGELVVRTQGQPVPDNSDKSDWRVINACFTKDYRAYLFLTPPQQFPGYDLRMYEGTYGGGAPDICKDGFWNINLTRKPA
ncbi:hypothetical protein [Nocardia otitidiscaviarum]|uniref:hypothetical protein n=1 Tax=Nocardia otitidiscaviarum TaxID=1823 RepID=UPI002456F79D|nr:hypothetical protein [Nocardia otitidiscaviarum]